MHTESVDVSEVAMALDSVVVVIYDAMINVNQLIIQYSCMYVVAVLYCIKRPVIKSSIHQHNIIDNRENI